MDRNFNVFLLISITLHIACFTLFAVSQNFYKPYKQSQEHVFFMHVVSMSDINNIQTRLKKKSKLPQVENAKKVDAPVSKTPKTHSQIKEIPQAIKNEASPQTPITRPTDKPKQPTEPKPKQTKLPPFEIKTKPKSPTKPQKSKKEIDLKELEKFLSQKSQVNKERASEGTLDKSNKKSGSTNKDDQDSSSTNYNPNMEEFANSKTLLKQKIESNWNKPPSMRDYNKLHVRVNLTLDLNQEIDSISKFEFLNESVPDVVKVAIKDSITRAIKLSAPFDFFAMEHYEHWKNIPLIFSYN